MASGNTVDTAGSLILLNGMQLGTTASTRVGQNITIRSVECRVINRVTAGTGVDQTHRFGLYVDKQCNGVALTGVDLLNAATIYGLRNLNNRSRFKCLLDKFIVLNATGEPGAEKYWHLYLKFKRPIVVQYNGGNAGTIADINSNSMYIYLIGSQAPGATAGTQTGYYRIRYTDQ